MYPFPRSMAWSAKSQTPWGKLWPLARQPGRPFLPPPVSLWTQNHPGLGRKITKNQKIHEIGRRGSVWRDNSAVLLPRPPRTSWDRSPGPAGKSSFLGPPWAPCWGQPLRAGYIGFIPSGMDPTGEGARIPQSQGYSIFLELRSPK